MALRKAISRFQKRRSGSSTQTTEVPVSQLWSWHQALCFVCVRRSFVARPGSSARLNETGGSRRSPDLRFAQRPDRRVVRLPLARSSSQVVVEPSRCSSRWPSCA